MTDTTMTNLVQTWVPVTDVQGQARLEARWTSAPPAGAPAQAPHAA